MTEPKPRPRGVLEKVAGRIRRFLHELAETAHLAHELRSWVASIPGTIPIREAPLRTRVRLAGEVREITTRPEEPFEKLEAVLHDGSGEVRIVGLGRGSTPGLTVGSHLMVEGVIGEENGERRMIDPAFGFVPMDAT